MTSLFKKIMIFAILGDPWADGRGEKQIKRPKKVQAEAW